MAEPQISLAVGETTMRLQVLDPVEPVIFFDGGLRRTGRRMKFFGRDGKQVPEQPEGVEIIESYGVVFFACSEAVSDLPVRTD